MSVSPRLRLPDIFSHRRRSLSPDKLPNAYQNQMMVRMTRPKYHCKDSSIKISKFAKIHQDLKVKTVDVSYSSKIAKAKLFNLNHEQVCKIQKENSALRDFISNFHLKQEGSRVVSSLDVLSEGTTITVTGKVQKYFNQLEESIKKL